MHKNDHSPPPAAFVERMLLRPYTIEKSEIKKQEQIRYPCRGVLHTPHKYSIKDHYTLHKYTSSPPLVAFVERMLLRPYRSWYTDLLTIRFFSFLVFFSCLDARKELKENQGVRDASQILGIQLIWTYPAKLPRLRQRAFSCLDARKEPKENQGIRDAGQIL